MRAFLDRYFEITKRQSSFRVEILGGLTTFLTMSYIIFVNPTILSLTGMDKGALMTVTCLISAVATLLMGVLAKAPMALAPGMGLNAFFTFSLVMGQGMSWEQALGVVFISGLLFLVLSISGVRRLIAQAIPVELTLAATAGIGMFIAFIGLNGMGLIVNNDATLVGLGDLSGTVLISLAALIIMKVLYTKKVPGSILIGVLVATILGIIFKKVELPKQIVSLPPTIEPIAFKLDILGAMKWSFFGVIFSFMFIDMFDSLSLLLSCSEKIGLKRDKNNEVQGFGKMLYVDVCSTLLGAVLGTSTVTTYAESASGIAVGAKTGFAAVVTAALFGLALLFTPLVSIVPMFAVAPALVIVGVMMFEVVALIDFSNKKIAITTFVTAILMPLTYSISTGISFGFLTYIILHVFTNDYKKISFGLWGIGTLCLLNLFLH